MVPDGSRNAQSRGPQPWSTGCLEHLGAGRPTFSNVASTSSEANTSIGIDPLREELRDGVALGRRPAGVRVGQDDAEAGLRGGAEGHPAELAGGHVLLDLEPECVPVEGERLVDVADGNVRVLE